MKKKLTMNSLAFGNLKNRKKQYTIMIIGIILSMVFSSSVIISLFSFHASRLEMGRNAMGIQDEILINISEEAMQKAQKDGYVQDYGFAHMVGYAAADKENSENGFFIAWLDDKAKELSYQSFIEGTYPENENEIAIEKAVLLRLGTDVKIGDEINLEVFPQNGKSYIESSNHKSYTLVGIAEDKFSHMDTLSDTCLASAFVCEGTQTDVGGKEILDCYFTFADFDFEPVVRENGFVYIQDRNTVFLRYLEQNGFLEFDESYFYVYTDYRNYYGGYFEDSNILYVSIIGIVLSLTSCIAIVNSFNSNLKERKKQIGMLRAVGTTKRQIVHILGREALIISIICIPVSLIISYLFVLAISSVFGESFILTVDIISVIACGIVGLCTVMLAALIPILLATRITPMQAIRDVDVSRRMKNKKIKSQKSFSVPKLLAKRNMAFHKGSQIAVSIMLIATIAFSCAGFSFYKSEKEYVSGHDYDYYINAGFDASRVMYNSLDNKSGISDADKQAICAAPYITSAYGIKKCSTNILIDEYTDYYKIFTGAYEDWNGEDIITTENYAEKVKGNFSEYYSAIKSQLGYDKDLMPTSIYAVDDWKLETLKNNLAAGEINLDKLASGEEIILVAPQKAAIGLKFIEHNNFWEITVTDDEVNTDKFEYALYGECDYKAGDTIALSTIYVNDEDIVYTDTETIYNLKKADKQVKIGAIISPNCINEIDRYMTSGSDFAVLTSVAGMNSFSKTEMYQEIYMYVNGEINDDINETIVNSVEPILYKYNTNIYSEYERIKTNESANKSMLVAMISLIIIGFAICAGIANNAFTASIRERKKELGTLRAVGISRREFVSSYVRQLLLTFAIGYGGGFGSFTLVYLISSVVVYFKNQSLDRYLYTPDTGMIYSPWITIAFCITLFAVCSINLWLKIKKEMKNSIIDNIREL